ncbi:hypothetical protein [Komagataeibacter diospyri]|uniref:hypothetical protein n=1 Tax=Komagataeibacter diospyri TaxID=1932662 RepID=UPI001133EAF6|nr:hypothetical protein [Komagataeibacter diospyri]GCE91472.1 hypothetical protein MSKU15_3073 [Komagataeibacter diospyri]
MAVLAIGAVHLRQAIYRAAGRYVRFLQKTIHNQEVFKITSGFLCPSVVLLMCGHAITPDNAPAKGT